MNTPESIMKPHPGMVKASNRYGIGGPDGQSTMSFGFGKTPEDALIAARTEFKSYFDDLSDTIESVTPFESERVVILNKENLGKIGLDINDVIYERTNDNAYLMTNIISDNLKYKTDVEYILAPSSPGQPDMTLNIHKIGK